MHTLTLSIHICEYLSYTRSLIDYMYIYDLETDKEAQIEREQWCMC